MKYIITICTLIIATVFSNYSFQANKLFYGKVQLPEYIVDEDTKLYVYYKGQKINLEASDNIFNFSFLDSKQTQELHILICNKISCITQDNNTIDHLKLVDPEYKCFKLQALRIQDDNQIHPNFSWDIRQEKLYQNIIPENTLIFLFDPNLIDDLVVKTWSQYQGLRLIPTIVIKHASQEKLNRAMNIATLAALDLDLFHGKKTIECSDSYNRTKTLVTMLNE